MHPDFVKKEDEFKKIRADLCKFIGDTFPEVAQEYTDNLFRNV